MCGIVGYIGNSSALEVILSGLQKLEYRGYDSAGVAIYEHGEVFIARASGKLGELHKELDKSKRGREGTLGIGHTRWATHGRPTQDNAHPHSAGRVSLIHNGIIENYIELRKELEAKGSRFSSETDTEIAAHLLNSYLQQGESPFDALKKACARLRGSYAFVALDKDHPDRLLVAKNATPIVVGIGEEEMFVASDVPAILNSTRQVCFLEDGDIAEIQIGSVRVENGGISVERPVQRITWDPVTAQKGGYKHYMLKEIHEQSRVVSETFRGRVDLEKHHVVLPELKFSDEKLAAINRIVLLACGTAWHACLVGKFYLEDLTGIPCDVDYASEYRYRGAIYDENTLVIVVSQSGETADTLAALELVHGTSPTLAICNALGSSIARKVDECIFTHAGPEISVASTKAFTTQLVVLYLLASYMGEKRGHKSTVRPDGLVSNLFQLPALLDEAVKTSEQVKAIAKTYHRATDFLFLGRGICYPIALEGALKMKEISYIHAEGYPAGEMKHGPIALIDEKLPVVVVLQKSDLLFEKTLSNLREVHSRAGQIIAITDELGHEELHALCAEVVEVPFLSQNLSPIILNIPLQLLAYHVAVFNGTDVDLPRNLAKSVTVE